MPRSGALSPHFAFQIRINFGKIYVQVPTSSTSLCKHLLFPRNNSSKNRWPLGAAPFISVVRMVFFRPCGRSILRSKYGCPIYLSLRLGKMHVFDPKKVKMDGKKFDFIIIHNHSNFLKLVGALNALFSTKSDSWL